MPFPFSPSPPEPSSWPTVSFEDAPIVGTGPFDGVSCSTILTPCVTVLDWTTASDLSILLIAGVGGNTATYLDGGATIPAANGNNFVGADGSCCVLGPISQTLNGLTVGDTYNLTFDQAAAQLGGNSGATAEQWIVTIGGTISASPGTVILSDGITPYNPAYVVDSPEDQWRSPVISNASGGFSGWESESYTFTANNSSELLAFLAVGTPVGAPPMVLLDNVSVDAASAPEPKSLALALLAAGLVVVASVRRARRTRGSRSIT